MVVAVVVGSVGLVTALVGDVILTEWQDPPRFPVASTAPSGDGTGQRGRPSEVMLDQLPGWGSAARLDGEGPVEFDQAATDLASFAAVADDQGRSEIVDLLTRSGFIDEYYRRWLVPVTDRPMLIVVELFRFRDAQAAAEVRGTLAELLSSPSVASRGEAWQDKLAGGRADLVFALSEPLQVPTIPDLVSLDAHVEDADRAGARGLTYQLIAFNDGPLLANITIVYPPELSKSVGQDRAREIARLQHARM